MAIINNSKGIQFIKAAILKETDDCIIWPYSQYKNGYGQVTFNGGKTQAHRVACILAHGLPPEGKNEALHAPIICHDRSCVNKRHLRWGSRQDNFADMKIDGTDRQGVKHPLARLNNNQVVEIYTASKPYKFLAERFGVGVSAIGKIKRGERWAHVTAEL